MVIQYPARRADGEPSLSHEVWGAIKEPPKKPERRIKREARTIVLNPQRVRRVRPCQVCALSDSMTADQVCDNCRRWLLRGMQWIDGWWEPPDWWAFVREDERYLFDNPPTYRQREFAPIIRYS